MRLLLSGFAIDASSRLASPRRLYRAPAVMGLAHDVQLQSLQSRLLALLKQLGVGDPRERSCEEESPGTTRERGVERPRGVSSQTPAHAWRWGAMKKKNPTILSCSRSLVTEALSRDSSVTRLHAHTSHAPPTAVAGGECDSGGGAKRESLYHRDNRTSWIH